LNPDPSYEWTRLIMVNYLQPDFLVGFSIFIVLVILSATISATETAYSALNNIRVKNLAKGRSEAADKAKLVYSLVGEFPSLLASVLILNNIVNITASSLVTYLFVIRLGLGSLGAIIATVVVATLVIIFGEIIPKNIAKIYPEKVAFIFARPLQIAMIVLKPITALFSRVSTRIEELGENDESRVTATEKELVEIVETIEKEGVLEQTESEIIKGAIHLDDKTVSQIMSPKDKVLFVQDDIEFEELIQVLRKSVYSRIPVYSKSKKTIIGILRQRDVFDYITRSGYEQKFDIYKVMRVANFISYRRNLSYALEKMQRLKSHMLIVVDNIQEKQFQGILTLEDILEELVGEIYDESDRLPKGVVEIGHHIFEVNPESKLEDLFDDYLDDTDYPSTSAVSVGAWVKQMVKGKKLKEGLEVTYDNLIIKIIKVNGKIIEKLEITQLTKLDEDDELN
jgi:putative hemolysin